MVLERTFTADGRAAAVACRFVRDQLVSFDEATRGAAELLVAEPTSRLGDDGEREFSVAVEISPPRIRIAVTGCPGTAAARSGGHAILSTKGVRIFEALADRWDIERGPASTRIWFELEAGNDSTGPTPADLLGLLVASGPPNLTVLDTSARYLRVSDSVSRLMGQPDTEILGRTVQDVRPEAWTVLEPLIRRVLGGETLPAQTFVVEPGISSMEVEPGRLTEVRPSDRVLKASHFPLVIDGQVRGVGTHSIDITDDVRPLVESVRSAEALQRRSDMYGRLANLEAVCARATEESEVYAALCELAASVPQITFAWVAVHDQGRIRPGASRGVDNGFLGGFLGLAQTVDLTEIEPLAPALRAENIQVANNLALHPLIGRWKELIDTAGFAASASFPLLRAGKVAANFIVDSPELDVFDDELVNFLTRAAALASFALGALGLRSASPTAKDVLLLRQGALDAISQGILITDARTPGHPIIYASPSFVQLTGYTQREILGRNCRFLQGPDTDQATVAEIRKAVEAARGCAVEILNYKKDGEPFWNELTVSPIFDDRGELIRFIGVQNDISDRRKLQHQLAEAQKLEAIGTLAGGIAHDFNNLLLVVRGYASVLLRHADDPEVRQAAERIEAAVSRGAEFTRQLLAYSRRQINRPELIDLNEKVQAALQLLERMVGEDIALTTELATDLPRVRLDPSQMEQVILNLVTNARDAMPGGGTLSVRTAVVELAGSGMGPEEVVAGPYALLAVTDTGQGMEEATRQRIFDPFFTTKPEGTGLGLAVVVGIVRQAGGHVHVYSEPGIGTTFKLYFPPVAVEDVGGAGIEPHAKSVTSLAGCETILLVEDVAEARSLLATALRDLGYEVLEASDGAEALGVVEAHPGRLDAVVTDVVMPEMNGRELVERLAAHVPGLRVIFTSGYPANVLRSRDLIDDQLAFLEKPYRSEDVASLLRQLLER